ncbi:MAG: sugar phosphate isomerase/epimerase [Firmicutes bacterium]|nr:sugar phosphate isomerase/epimerase [Bacillota bacterium]
MKYGISAICYESGVPITKNLHIPAREGISIIELNADKPSAFPLEDPAFIPSLKAEIVRLGITVNSIHSPIHNSISDPNPAVRNQGVDEIIHTMEQCIPIAELFTTPVKVIIHPGHHTARTSNYIQAEYCFESLGKILTHPVSQNYRICVENMLSSHFGGRPGEIVDIIKKFPQGAIGACLDTSHSVYDSSPEEFLDAVFPWLETTHISDNFNQSAGEYHAIPFTIRHSKVNWEQFFRKLSTRLDTAVFEVIRPRQVDMDIFTRMFKCSLEQIERWINNTGA